MRRQQRKRTRVSVPGDGKRLRLIQAELIPPAARTHLRAAVREGILALASLGEAALKAVEGSARQTRQRIERIPVKGKR